MALVIADRVKETTTTTGTGAKTLGGAMPGFVTFASRCNIGDTFYYCQQSVDEAGFPSGDFEVGLASYSGVNTITPINITASSNSDNAVNWAAGTKQVWITIAAAQAAWPRERLTTGRTYYVRTDGSDSNNGSANTSGSAFLTIQKAIDTACVLDTNGFDVTISVAPGTYTGSNTLKTITGGGKIVIDGASHDLTSTVISTTNENCFTQANGFVGTYQLQYMKLQTTTSGFGIYVVGGGVVLYQNLNFGACATYHMLAATGGYIKAIGNYTISGGAAVHFAAYDGGQIRCVSITITLSGTPGFSGAFALATCSGTLIANASTFSGTATGKRYDATRNGVINTEGGGASYFPGNAAGTTSSGGVYA